MPWKKITVDEYAEFERANGARLRYINGIWWRKVRPFFYRPLYFNTKLVPCSVQSPNKSLIGGFQHLVSDRRHASSYMNFLLFSNTSSYSVDSLSRNYRKNIKKAQRNLVIKPVINLEEFIHSAYPVYLHFYHRTHYSWGKYRIDQKGFIRWANILFSFSHILILGAYHDHKLEAVSVSYLIEDSVIYGTFFCSEEGLKLRASELMLHELREMASYQNDIHSIYLGMYGNKSSLDLFKISRGCTITSEPAYLSINPILLLIFKHCWKSTYSKLMGIDPMLSLETRNVV